MTPWLLVQFNYQFDKEKKAVCASCDGFQLLTCKFLGIVYCPYHVNKLD